MTLEVAAAHIAAATATAPESVEEASDTYFSGGGDDGSSRRTHFSAATLNWRGAAYTTQIGRQDLFVFLPNNIACQTKKNLSLDLLPVRSHIVG